MADRKISITRTIAAPPERIFDLLADPAKHPVLDGSGTVRDALPGGPQRLSLGARFGMDMKFGMAYKITNRVVEFEENRLIAWRHFGGHRWRWQLEPAGDGGTEVTETFDWSTAPAGFAYGAMGFLDRNRTSIERSLGRLAELFPG